MIKSEVISGVPEMVFKTRVRDESIGGDNHIDGKMYPQTNCLVVRKF